MALAPATTASRGEIALQPSYFTSSLYVHAIREDIERLVRLFSARYLSSPGLGPFALFKQLWVEEGWCWLHLKVLEYRARDTFLATTLRLFSERCSESEPSLTRVLALWAIYTFFWTQPSVSAPTAHSVSRINIPLDVYASLLDLPTQLKGQPLVRLHPYTVFVLDRLLQAGIFHITPASHLCALNPRDLPREVFVPDASGPGSALGAELPGFTSDVSATAKRKGRPTKREKLRKAKEAASGLGKWLEKTELNYRLEEGRSNTRELYRQRKSTLLDVLEEHSLSDHGSSAALENANEAILSRLQKIKHTVDGNKNWPEIEDQDGLARVERVVVGYRRRGQINENPLSARGGLLSLLEGAGRVENEQPNSWEGGGEEAES
ncbi:hypothetical protein PUNSTDRAFT_56854 [Punctularia strigosozonata HHB-11173 SS5]|uniref:uncharacterized protein n=1 Tax=Punctularia strigosozonata (strain HHB-11173) TaxID=741275 RepID=UPI00044177AE|nr:uncharacterized protein PUNSTDRAFT_56854 [Punctularia strigosozonata HHB-11173 SS5]EIN14051.1 hypothetical protein PUNSTDRAFT_56854 [Punctularia strigosozonata HHB-11173 SS5]